MATGSMPSHSLEMAIRPPASYGISTMPQPVSAPMLLYHQSVTNLAGVQKKWVHSNHYPHLLYVGHSSLSLHAHLAKDLLELDNLLSSTGSV